jgi:hypothetical protein
MWKAMFPMKVTRSSAAGAGMARREEKTRRASEGKKGRGQRPFVGASKRVTEGGTRKRRRAMVGTAQRRD